MLIAISGAGLTTGPLVQSRGGKFICDRGSTHQRFQDEVMADEYRRWGVPTIAPPAHILRREEAIYALADAITVPSNVARRSFIQMGVPAEKLHVIPYGVRLDKFHSHPTASPRTSDIRFLRSPLRRTDQPTQRNSLPAPGLCPPAPSTRAPHPRRRGAGRGPSDARRPPHPKCNLYRIDSPAGARPLMSRSHVLALPSVEEGLALVQGQAMACGCPVVATAATGAEDLFTNCIEGFIIPPRDPIALAERLQQLADDPALRSRMSAAALARVKTLGGWDRYGDLWDTLLHSLTGIPPDPAELL